ncbi:DUF4352 domain-containing protein [Alkalibacillus aidingensis]|uniref:DUF4352 domain-containing protein n=1 Tax=Alkalibacillus aidingensis TaxID=2747607 RepID=UPI0016603A5A|nr:DUF4352 domain-containing protein [Alkalibacillus aidingensis]
MKRFTLLFMLLVLALFLAACGESSVETVDGEESEETTESSNEEDIEKEDQDESSKEDTEVAEESSEEEEQNVSIGDSIQFDDLKITLIGARQIESDNEFITEDNDLFLAVELEMENTGDEEESLSTMLSMSLFTDDGYSQDQTFMVDGRGSLDGSLGAGRSMKGEIVFDVETAEFYEFIFENPFTSGQAIWEIPSEAIQ